MDSSVTRYYGQLSPCAISEKNNDPILRKLINGWMDRHVEGPADDDLKGSCDFK